MGRVTVFRAQGSSLERLGVDADTLDEATLKTGHGIYTVLAVYPGGRVLRLESHFQRMRRSAELLNQPYRVEGAWLRHMLRQVVDQPAAPSSMSRIRLTVPFDSPDTALIAVEPFTPPPARIYEQGVRVGLINAHRDTPRAKNSRFVERRKALVEEANRDYYEVLLCLDDGTILEGTGSNFYAVLDGELRTAEEGVLPGIARSVLLEVAPAVLPVSLTPVNRADLPRLSEALLTSASRGPIPIVKIGDAAVNGGAPGPVYRALKARYDAVVERELQSL